MAQGHCRQPLAPGHQAHRKRTQFTSPTWKNGNPHCQNSQEHQCSPTSSTSIHSFARSTSSRHRFKLGVPSQNGENTRIGIFLCHSPHHTSSVPLVLSTQTGLVSQQFHCVFDDDFDTVKKEQADTSIWKIKAHLQEAKEIVSEKTTRSSLISALTHQPTSPLPPYGRDIPQALQDLSQLLPDVPATGHQPEEPSNPPAEEPTPTSPIATPEAQDPVHVPVEHHQQDAPSVDPPVVIAPSGYTRTGCQVRRPARFPYTAYHCKNLAQTGIQSVCDFHPFASLWAFASTIAQPDGYPDPMPLNVAMQQPDRDKFISAMARELGQHTELKHWNVIHKSQDPKNAKPIPMVWTLRRKRDPAGEILKWKARLCAGGHRQVFGDTYWTTFALWYRGQQ